MIGEPIGTDAKNGPFLRHCQNETSAKHPPHTAPAAAVRSAV
jgi:hypothetical protein